MDKLKDFKLDIHNLKEGKYDFFFKVNSEFFETLAQNLIEKGELEVKLLLSKSSNMIKANFETKGEVELTCDRTLYKFKYPIDTKNSMIYKFGDREEELTDELIMIKPETSVIDVSNLIFDFIVLSIPIKKIHPDYITEKDNEENDILIYSSVSNDKELTDNNIDILDPRWEALKKLKDTF